MSYNKTCEGCFNILSITSFKNDGENPYFSILPGSRHVAFFNNKFFHLKCLDGFCEVAIANKAKEIPEKSLTDFSQLNSKKEIQLNCCICLENKDIWLFMMPCTHILCYECFDEWDKKSRKCPTCNTDNYGLNKSFELARIVPEMIKQQTVDTPCMKKKSNKEHGFLTSLPTTMPKLERESSTPYTQTSLSTPCPYAYTDKSYEKLKKVVVKEGDKIEIMKQSESKSLDDFSGLIEGDGPLFISATTEKYYTLGFNDLVCKIYSFDEEVNEYKASGFLNYANLEYDNMTHSGDNMEKRFEHNLLQHGVLIESGTKKKIHFLNENIEGKEIVSINECTELHQALDSTLESYIINLQETPKSIVICSQVTYEKNKTLKELSKNLSPSCGFIMNKKVYACDWSDETNMTIWGLIQIF